MNRLSKRLKKKKRNVSVHIERMSASSFMLPNHDSTQLATESVAKCIWLYQLISLTVDTYILSKNKNIDFHLSPLLAYTLEINIIAMNSFLNPLFLSGLTVDFGTHKTCIVYEDI